METRMRDLGGYEEAEIVADSHSLGILIEWKLIDKEEASNFSLFPLAGDIN